MSTVERRYIPGALSELRARRDRMRIDLGHARAAIVALTLWAAVIAGAGLITVGFWKAWEPLGYLFSGVALIACSGLFAYMRGRT